MVRLDYSLRQSSRGKPSRVKATGLWLGAACKPNLWSKRLEKDERRAKHPTRIEAVRLYAFTLPSSPLDDTLSHVCSE
jgi:hypothetical protein